MVMTISFKCQNHAYYSLKQEKMNIYVGNLDHKVTEQELKELFVEFGQVESAKIISDKYSGRSRGFGFVVMEDKDEAQKAIESLNNKSINDRAITVNEAKPRRENY
jgi:RNA recognition motif-containing protein